MIRDLIVIGVLDSKLSKQLQLDDALTLERAVTRATQSELVGRQQETVRQTESKNVDFVKSDASRSGGNSGKKRNLSRVAGGTIVSSRENRDQEILLARTPKTRKRTEFSSAIIQLPQMSTD